MAQAQLNGYNIRSSEYCVHLIDGLVLNAIGEATSGVTIRARVDGKSFRFTGLFWKLVRPFFNEIQKVFEILEDVGDYANLLKLAEEAKTRHADIARTVCTFTRADEDKNTAELAFVLRDGSIIGFRDGKIYATTNRSGKAHPVQMTLENWHVIRSHASDVTRILNLVESEYRVT